jgi:hypothetical protein
MNKLIAAGVGFFAILLVAVTSVHVVPAGHRG